MKSWFGHFDSRGRVEGVAAVRQPFDIETGEVDFVPVVRASPFPRAHKRRPIVMSSSTTMSE